MRDSTLVGAPLLLLLVSLIQPVPAAATWSIVVADSVTGEVGIASVTCLESFDLRAITPVMLVGVGGAVVQAAGDFDGTRRPIIHDELLAGTPPDAILAFLAGVPGHPSRQYGIADTEGRMISFTGTSNGAWASGVSEEMGTAVYAIQGNVLAGECVVLDTEAAFLATPGDIPDKLMVAMEAARNAGGDGRCSCLPGDPTACGCPPPSPGKSGHIGYMLVARIGDTDDPLCDRDGCADGDYFLNLNFAFQPDTSPDPVDQLRDAFDSWREAHVGRPDAIRSRVTIRPVGGAYEMEIELRDWQELPISVSVIVSVQHEADSAGLSVIGSVVDEGGGRFKVSLTPAAGSGIDRFRVTADDGVRPVVLMPSPRLALGADCVAALGPVSQLKGRKSGVGGATFQWTTDPFASEYHLNSVSEKGLLTPPGPHRPPAAGGVAAAECDALAPEATCTDADALGAAPQLFYQVVSACGPSGDDEGPFF